MEAHQERVLEEKNELDIKREKLRDFFGTDKFKSLDVRERDRMTRQYNHMTDYSKVLQERITAFNSR